jgi:hypothetical protein
VEAARGRGTRGAGRRIALAEEYTLPENPTNASCRADPRGRAAVMRSQEHKQHSSITTAFTVAYGLHLDSSTGADQPVPWTEAWKIAPPVGRNSVRRERARTSLLRLPSSVEKMGRGMFPRRTIDL